VGKDSHWWGRTPIGGEGLPTVGKESHSTKLNAYVRREIRHIQQGAEVPSVGLKRQLA
jgi:hypothetical protein